MDKLSPIRRSWNMSRIRSKNTKPEVLLRKALRQQGLRYRLHFNIPGKPDIVFPSKKYVIFVHGCFWHGHDCVDGHIPKTNISFWQNKITRNKLRDRKNIRLLTLDKWKVVNFWECELKNNYEKTASIVYNELQQ